MLFVHFKRNIENIHYTIKVIEIFLNLICMFFILSYFHHFSCIYCIIEEQGKNGYFISNN